MTGTTHLLSAALLTVDCRYYEYSRDLSVLREKVYPFVKDNAEFYASYVTTDANGTVVLPYTCGQEQCVCRDYGKYHLYPNDTTLCQQPTAPNSVRCDEAPATANRSACRGCMPDVSVGPAGGPGSHSKGEHNAHADIAFASASFRIASRYSQLLGVDADRRHNWQRLLQRMPPYPSTTLRFVEGSGGAEAGLNGLPGLFTEAEWGHVPGIAAEWFNVNVTPAVRTVPVIWPFCNAEYPIASVAAMWPCDEIGTVQTANNTALLAVAKATVFALNDATGWANTNGFCLSWPPAVRVSDATDAAVLVGRFRSALDRVMGVNGNIHLGGGMLENSGATVAINDMLLQVRSSELTVADPRSCLHTNCIPCSCNQWQSHAGRLRFFPVWNSTVLGPASFVTLRAYGAFVVSAAIDSAGRLSDVSIQSEMGGTCVFEWTDGRTPSVLSSGKAVAVAEVEASTFAFATVTGGRYVITSSD